MNVTGWIGIGSLAIVGTGVSWSMVYSLRDSLRRQVAPSEGAGSRRERPPVG